MDGPLTAEHLEAADRGVQDVASKDRDPRVADVLRRLALEALGPPGQPTPA